MTPIRFIMAGGFLGAGKTTTIGKLARRFTAQNNGRGVDRQCAALDPERLASEVQRAVEAACQQAGASPNWQETKSFRPGRPIAWRHSTRIAK